MPHSDLFIEEKTGILKKNEATRLHLRVSIESTNPDICFLWLNLFKSSGLNYNLTILQDVHLRMRG